MNFGQLKSEKKMTNSERVYREGQSKYISNRLHCECVYDKRGGDKISISYFCLYSYEYIKPMQLIIIQIIGAYFA